MNVDREDNFGRCPYCKDTKDENGMSNGMLMVLRDWADMHEKEVLLHCWDCDRKYVMYYKFDKVVELIENEMESWFDESKDTV